MATATGQITIIDYNDALTLSGFINSNNVKTQMYNPDNGSYTPDWSKTPLILTPSLYKIGTTADIITNSAVKSVKWYEVTDGKEVEITATSTRNLSGTKNHILTISANEMAGIPGKDYICKITYHDDTTQLDLIHQMSISFSRVVNGSGIVDAIAMCPEGNYFKNKEVASIKANCDLWRGSVVDATNVSYQWYKQDSSVTTDEGAGIGWKKLTNTADKYAGVTTRELTVYPGGITNIGVFKCGIKDTDSTSTSYNSTFWDTVTIIDNTDPVVVSITSTGGDVFKNGVGSTTLTAKLFQAGTEIDEKGTEYSYKWNKYLADGTLDANFGGTGIATKTGKTISVTSADVNVKSTFICEVE